MTLDLLCIVLACRDSFIEANPHKVLAATVGFSFLTAAFFVRQHRNDAVRKGYRGHAFEVLMDTDRGGEANEETRNPNEGRSPKPE